MDQCVIKGMEWTERERREAQLIRRRGCSKGDGDGA